MSRQPLLALALVRLVTGLLFAGHGIHMVFVQGLAAATAQFQGQGVPLPLLTAPLVATLELAGGLLLALGLGTRVLALLLMLVTASTLYFTQGGRVFFGAGELGLPTLLLACTLALALGGPGAPAFDNLRARSVPSPALTPQKPGPRKGAKAKG